MQGDAGVVDVHVFSGSRSSFTDSLGVGCWRCRSAAIRSTRSAGLGLRAAVQRARAGLCCGEWARLPRGAHAHPVSGRVTAWTERARRSRRFGGPVRRRDRLERRVCARERGRRRLRVLGAPRRHDPVHSHGLREPRRRAGSGGERHRARRAGSSCDGRGDGSAGAAHRDRRHARDADGARHRALDVPARPRSQGSGTAASAAGQRSCRRS